MSKSKSKKPEEIPPKCKERCFSKGKICPKSPCYENLFKFGTHERILDHYRDEEEWDETYYYFQDLLPLFNFNCDIQQLEEFKKINQDYEEKNLPVGCRVFKDSSKLRDIKNTLIMYKKMGKNISREGMKTYDLKKIEFKRILNGSFERLKHLAIDKRGKDEEKEQYHKRLLELYATAFQARKLGLNVEDGLGTALEKGFENAAMGAGLKTEELAKFNARRMKEAEISKQSAEMRKQMKLENIPMG